MNGEIDKQNRPSPEDTVLIRAFQADDKAAFDNLVLRYQDKVFGLCYRFLGEYEDASDCAQETFVKVYRSLKGFGFRSAFSTWLYRITVNVCKNRLTSKQYRVSRRMVRLDDPGDPASGIYPVEISDESLSPAEEGERRERQVLIQKAIDSLPPEQKTVVVLRDIEGFSYAEIAGITGANLGTVKSKLARARARLSEKLSGVVNPH